MRITFSLAVCTLLFVQFGCNGETTGGPKDAVKNRFLAVQDVSKAVVLEQNWSDESANWFYNVSQGSHLLPYEWFLQLEQADSEQLFRDEKNMWKLGFLPRTPGGENPDGLPIGFAKDNDKVNKRDWVGLNCAACHTSQINYNGVGYLVDGASSHSDLSGFLRQLAAALEKTSADEQKFDRFAANVLGPNPSDSDKAALKTQLGVIIEVRKGYNDRNVLHDHDYARIDAFGSILNETMGRFLELDENVAPPNAPVSIPFIWDAPQHNVVQWNGSAPNGLLGSLGRNTGEVLGVFGNFGKDNIPMEQPLLGYPSTVQIPNLATIENTLTELWSPLWPDDFPKIDAEQASAGKKLFGEYCSECHKSIDRTDPNRKIIAQMGAVDTDSTMVDNFEKRKGKTGRLEGKHMNFNPLGKTFEKEAPGIVILRHEVIGAILGSGKTAPPDELDGILNPQVSGVAMVEPGAKYKGRPLNGIWATAPYLHNGSVHSLDQLLLPAANRDKKFWVGSHEFDPVGVGFKIIEGGSELDTSLPGNSNAGHEFGTGVSEDDGGDGLPELNEDQRKQLVEYMKTL